MSQEPMLVSCAYGCVGCSVLLVIAIVIGSLVIQSVGLGTVVFFIVCCAAFWGVMLYRWSAEKKGE
ncbi:hypothetical protein ACWGDS_36715 [Streptomyces sp. NPDC055059]|uniref:hypothetical protein n=1 Tax=unclassified Streptomyces TaxID=2593676 RepID=UPI0033A6CC9D